MKRQRDDDDDVPSEPTTATTSAGDAEAEAEDIDEDYDDDTSDSSDSEGESVPVEVIERRLALVIGWLDEQKEDGRDPMKLLKDLGLEDYTLWKLMTKEEEKMTDEEKWELVEQIMSHPSNAKNLVRYLLRKEEEKNHRKRIPGIDTLDDVAKIINESNNIVVLTGAGVSVSCGIPDFRSPNGLYAQIEDKYDLPDPQCLFDIEFLRIDPRPFFEFAKEIYPGSYVPSPTHFFIKELDKRNKLLRNYTQNIDTLEAVAGIDQSKVVTCHGSFATATCMECGKKVSSEDIKEDIVQSKIPYCDKCEGEDSFFKPDIVFFGEPLPDRFRECLDVDREKVDLLLVIGSSLSVKPVAYIPHIVAPTVTQILVNRELVARPHEFDYAHLGFSDEFSIEISKRLGWNLPVSSTPAPPPSTKTITATTTTTTTTITVVEDATISEIK